MSTPHSLASQRFIEVEDRQADGRRARRARRDRAFGPAGSRPRSRSCPGPRHRPRRSPAACRSSARRTSRSWSVGLRQRTRRNACVSRPPGSEATFMLRSASIRAASTQVGSLSVVRACSGVLVWLDRTRQVCRFDVSNMLAGLTVPPPERVEAAPIEVVARGRGIGEVPFLGDREGLPDLVGLIGIDGLARRSRGRASRWRRGPVAEHQRRHPEPARPAWRRFSRSRGRCSAVTRLDCR